MLVKVIIPQVSSFANQASSISIPALYLVTVQGCFGAPEMLFTLLYVAMCLQVQIWEAAELFSTHWSVTVESCYCITILLYFSMSLSLPMYPFSPLTFPPTALA